MSPLPPSPAQTDLSLAPASVITVLLFADRRTVDQNLAFIPCSPEFTPHTYTARTGLSVSELVSSHAEGQIQATVFCVAFSTSFIRIHCCYFKI